MPIEAERWYENWLDCCETLRHSARSFGIAPEDAIAESQSSSSYSAPVDGDTAYSTGSWTKPFTSTTFAVLGRIG